MASPEQVATAGSSGTVPEDPLVSMGLPVFNGAPFLEDCLDSLLAQTYRNFELLISDNASTDGTPSICERYAAQDARIRVSRADRNRGAAWNHNRVRELARGSYFRWCGADDLVAPRFVEACVEALQQAPAAVLAFPLSVVIDDTGQATDQTSARLDLDAPDRAWRFRRLLSSLPFTQNPFYGVMRSTALARVRPIGSFLANDRSFLAELSLHGPFVRVEEFLMFRRRHAAHRVRKPETDHYLIDPSTTAGYWPREWTMLREHARSAAQAPGGLWARARLLGVVAAWAASERGALASEARGAVAYLARRLGVQRPRGPGG